jgi:hypothetical protein
LCKWSVWRRSTNEKSSIKLKYSILYFAMRSSSKCYNGYY